MGQPYTRLIVLIAINAATVCPQTSTKINTCSKGENVSSNIERNSEIERLTLEKKTRKDRAEEWDKYNIAFIFLAGFAAVGLVITGIGVSRSNGALNKSSEELSHAKDLRAEEEIAAVNCLAGDANERAAEANRTAEQEKLARVRLEERFAWRRINPKEHDALVALLKPHAGALVELRQHGEIEAATFADDIIKTLGDSGWAVRKSWVGMVMPPTYGLQCTINESLPAGQTLAAAFKSLPTVQIRSDASLPVIARIDVALKPPP